MFLATGIDSTEAKFSTNRAGNDIFFLDLIFLWGFERSKIDLNDSFSQQKRSSANQIKFYLNLPVNLNVASIQKRCRGHIVLLYKKRKSSEGIDDLGQIQWTTILKKRTYIYLHPRNKLKFLLLTKLKVCVIMISLAQKLIDILALKMNKYIKNIFMVYFNMK